MINQGLAAQGRKYELLPNFGFCCKELGGSKLRVFGHASTVSAVCSRLEFADYDWFRLKYG